MSNINSIILLEMQSLDQMMNSFKQAIVPPPPTPEQAFLLSQHPGYSDLFQQQDYNQQQVTPPLDNNMQTQQLNPQPMGY